MIFVNFTFVAWQVCAIIPSIHAQVCVSVSVSECVCVCACVCYVRVRDFTCMRNIIYPCVRAHT